MDVVCCGAAVAGCRRRGRGLKLNQHTEIQTLYLERVVLCVLSWLCRAGLGLSVWCVSSIFVSLHRLFMLGFLLSFRACLHTLHAQFNAARTATYVVQEVSYCLLVVCLPSLHGGFLVGESRRQYVSGAAQRTTLCGHLAFAAASTPRLCVVACGGRSPNALDCIAVIAWSVGVLLGGLLYDVRANVCQGGGAQLVLHPARHQETRLVGFASCLFFVGIINPAPGCHCAATMVAFLMGVTDGGWWWWQRGA